MVGGVARGDVGEPGLGADADEREQARVLPLRRDRELLVAELHARELEGAVGMRLRQVHRHVEVGAAGLERGVEDRRVESWVARVDDRVRARRPRERGDRDRDRTRRLPPRRSAPSSGSRSTAASRTRRVEVGDDEAVEEVASLRGDRDRRSDSARPDDDGRVGVTTAGR